MDNDIVVDMPNHSPTPSPLLDPVSSKNDWPIVIQKGTHSIINPSPYHTNLSYHQLSTIHYACVFSLSSTHFPKSQGETLSQPEWRQPMIDGDMCISK